MPTELAEDGLRDRALLELERGRGELGVVAAVLPEPAGEDAAERLRPGVDRVLVARLLERLGGVSGVGDLLRDLIRGFLRGKKDVRHAKLLLGIGEPCTDEEHPGKDNAEPSKKGRLHDLLHGKNVSF